MNNMQKFPKSPKAPVYSPFKEPVEVGKTAVEQVMGTGAKEPDEPLVSQPQQESLPEEIVEARHRARLAQVRAEVEQIRQQERERGRGLPAGKAGKSEPADADSASVATSAKGAALAGKQDKLQPILEPQGRRPRGVWAGVTGLVKKLQRRVESPRGPVQ